MTSLPESFQMYGVSVLTRTPHVAHEWSAKGDGCQLSLTAATPSGFDIDFVVEPSTVTLGWGNWHTPFELETDIDAFVEHLFALLRDMLSPDMRVRELRAWPFAYRGFLESFDGHRWSTEHETGMIFWNYLGKRSERVYSNSVLPGRLSTGG